MKKTDLNRVLPFEEDYNLLSKYRVWTKRLMEGIFICSVLLPVLNVYSSNECVMCLRSILNFFYFISIVIFYIVNTYTETFLYPATARKRRKGFVDNSLGSKFLSKKIEGYYTNDNIDYGPYKMLINCYENCFFTLNIAKEMRSHVLCKNIIIFILFLLIAYWGISNSLIALPILQIFLSTLFLTELVHHFNFITKLEQLFERFAEVVTKDMDDEQVLQEAILLFLDYETILAYNKAPLSDSVYEQLNEKLSKEWEEIKNRYDIYK